MKKEWKNKRRNKIRNSPILLIRCYFAPVFNDQTLYYDTFHATGTPLPTVLRALLFVAVPKMARELWRVCSCQHLLQFISILVLADEP